MRFILYISFFLLVSSSLLACPSITISGTDATCFMGTDGSASATITGPNAPFSISWSDGTTGSVSSGGSTSISNLPAGVYTIYVVDAIGCTSTQVISVDEPDPVSGVVTGVVDVSCNGGADGSIDFTPSGGNGTYSFNWSNGGTTEDISGLTAGTYTVTVTDGNGCSSNTFSAVVSEPAVALTSTISGEDATCFGVSDGNIDLSPSGGTSPYSFVWSNGAVTEDLTNIPAGTYSVTITDDKGCTATNSFTINEPTGITSSISTTNVSCFEGSNGSVTLSVSGGTPGYRYLWGNASSTLVDTNQNLFNVPASTYFVTVTDANGCKHTNNGEVTEPDELLSTLTPSEVLCHGDSTGIVIGTTTGGTPGYSFSWSNGATSQSIINVKTGWYYYTVTDANSCSFSDSSFVGQPLEALYSFDSIFEPTCFKYNDGKVELVVEGGSVPYQHQWNRGDTTLTLFNVESDTLICSTTDVRGCILIDTLVVNQPDSLYVDSVVTDVTCFGLSDGIIDITVFGGTDGYDYYWTNSTYQLSENSQDLINYPADTYSLKVIDSNACEAVKTIVISEPPLMVGVLDVQDITCFGFDDGVMKAIVTGGNIALGPYVYNWSNGSMDTIIDSLPPGVYNVTVTDVKGCFVFMEDTIFEPPPIIVEAVVRELTCKDIADAQIEAFPTGGNGGFTYLWENDNETTYFIDEIPFGTYGLQVTDMLGCVKDTSFIVPESDVPCLNPPTAFTPQGDGYNDIWFLEKIELYPKADIKIFNQWGTIVYKSTGYQEPWDGRFNGRKLPAGTYYYRIEIEDGVIYSGPVTIVR